jgi:ribosomal 50S subunit-associated protein YjgA (DUF615 family)
MIRSNLDMAELAGRLNGVLDEQIALLEARRAQMERLSAALLERDEKATEAVLAEMEQAQQRQQGLDVKLEAVRNMLADALGWPAAEVRLGRLAEVLEGPIRTELEFRRQQIVVLARRVRQQHLETCFYLYECARINRLLLEAMLPSSPPVVTYGAKGSDQWRSQAGILDAEL